MTTPSLEMIEMMKKYDTPDKRLLALAQMLRKVTKLLDGDRKLIAETLTEIAEALTTEAVVLRIKRVDL